MSQCKEFAFDPASFDGRARLFPLPNLVMFPHVMQPLHIFEPRYREMVADALSGDRLIALGTLSPGWEQEYDGRPPVQPIACLGRIAAHHRLNDGRFNILLAGLCRFRLRRESSPDSLFRVIEGECLRDVYPTDPPDAIATLQAKLVDRLQMLLPCLPEGTDQLGSFCNQQCRLGALTDVISYSMDFDVCSKLSLLREVDVLQRARAILGKLKLATGDYTNPVLFPPQFSAN